MSNIDKAGNVGVGTEPMKHVNLRLPAYVLEFYQGYTNYTKAMRSVLKDFADRKLEEERLHENDLR